jgi:hypothetical protein
MAADRAYLIETATPGYTMTRQGSDVAIGRLNPEFVHRLAGAIREARQSRLSSVGIFSAYRPPAFGVGGFSNKFNSLHTYGLAVDMTGIGGPASVEAKTWYEITARHNIICPYGVDSRTEWNHCQPTKVKIILAENPLRETVTADGPVDLESMFEVGTALIERSANSERPELPHLKIERQGNEQGRAGHLTGTIRVVAHAGPPGWCKHLHHPDKATCGTVHQAETAVRTQIAPRVTFPRTVASSGSRQLAPAARL